MGDKIKKILYYYLILGFVLGFSIALLSIIVTAQALKK